MSPALIWSLLSVVYYLAVTLAVLDILHNRREPRGMLAWILALVALPLIGLILYMLVGPVPMQRKVRRRIRRRNLIGPSLVQKTAVLEQKHDARGTVRIDASTRSLMQLATRVSDAVVTSDNKVIVYHDAERAFLSLSLAIEAAERHVHMEYYIFANDETGRAMRDLLIRKASQGVEVRLLLDAVGCWSLSRRFVKEMNAAGVRVKFFLPWGLTNRRLQLNCRNHRKLTVIDGALAFSGSKNIADEYLGRKRRKLGPWIDTHLQFEGPCVIQMQEVFVEDWHFATGQDLASSTYFPSPVVAGEHLVQVVPSGPDGRSDVMHQLLNAAVADADRSITFITPYFVPDRAMILALTSAAYRGVRVRLLLPSRSDHWLVLWAGRTYYEDLLEAGVEIYEFDEAMIHSKVVVVDERWSMVGSANMDIRSFQLNFELTNILYDRGVATMLLSDFEPIFLRSRRIDERDVLAWTYTQTLAAGLARLATPIL